MTRPLLAALLLTAIGCGEPSVSKPDVGNVFQQRDAGVVIESPPRLDPAPAPLFPYEVVSLKGKAQGRRVFVHGLDNTLSYPLLPDGSFCIDLPLPGAGAYRLELQSQATSGALSQRSQPIEFTSDPSAPPIAGAQTCSGVDPAGCKGSVEICGNMIDDDCNSLIDEQDPTCASCTDDLLEPNNSIGAPRLDPGSYPNLQICGADPDFYGVFVQKGHKLTASIRFDHPEGNLDLQLLSQTGRSVITESLGQDSLESITHTSTSAGTYYLRVFGDMQTANSYQLDLSVSSGS